MKEGTPINNFDPKGEIRKNAENAYDWTYHNDAMVLYNLASRFRDELIDPIARVDREVMPDPIIGFSDARNNKILAYYTLGRNAHGIPDEIIFNTAHYEEKNGIMVWKFGRWSQFETLIHEQTHLYLNHLTKIDGKKRPAHGKEFCGLLESWGLHPVPVIGSHDQVADADSPFGRIMKDVRVQRPDDVPRVKGSKVDWFRPEKEKGKSTLRKWVCPDCGLAVRIGVNSDPRLVHDVCSEIKGEKVFLVKHDKSSHTIYKGDK